MQRSFAIAALAIVGTLAATSAGAVSPDHLQCFKIKDVIPRAKYTANLTPSDNTFAPSVGCTINVPAKLLCVDAVQSNVAPVPPGSAEGAATGQFLCYKAKCPVVKPTGAARDQFGTHTVTVKGTGLVCAPLEVPVHCLDMATTGDESDTDCGGGCPACTVGQDCAGGDDCDSGSCSMGLCQAPACGDTIRNGNETDIDCGGTCPDCGTGLGCSLPSDCTSGVCSTGICQAPSCSDSVENGTESDIDCGGTCADCGLGLACGSGADCASQFCSAGDCRFPSCTDLAQNGDETDTDCGGSCSGCALAKSCAADDDCASGVCSSGVCAACASDPDCAPGTCSAGVCEPPLGAACSLPADCASGNCVDGVCCDTPCDSSCEACTFAKNLSATSGTCAPIASGIDPDLECAGTDVCVAAACAPAVVVGAASATVPRADSCGEAQGRTCESLIGNEVADAFRTTYGVDFAIVNSGALRADLTCPGGGNGDCDASSPPPFQITAGAILTVAPFANLVTTTTLTGDVLKLMLENGVSSSPAAIGRFPQVSGLCFTYDVASPAGSRVTGAVRQAVDGSCTGASVSLLVGASYQIAQNDFMAAGGDGYPNLLSASTSHASVWQVVSDYIAGESPFTASLDGRITCTDSNGATAPNCPP